MTNLCGLRRCKSWSLLNATKRQFTRKMEVVGEPCDLAFWGVLGFSMMGIFSPLYHEQSIKCSVSFDLYFLMNLIYV